MAFLDTAGLTALVNKIKSLLSNKQDKITFNNDASQYLNGAGSFSKPPNTTYNAATTGSEGLMPKLSGTATQYLNGSGQWTTPPNTTYTKDQMISTIGVFTGATATTAGTVGLVPAPPAG